MAEPTHAEQLQAARSTAGCDAVPPWHECQRCGACCRGLIVECDAEDVVREPRIVEHALLLDGRGKLQPQEWNWGLVPGPEPHSIAGCCAFLGPGNVCGIYATRPAVCAAFIPGGRQCLDLRGEKGARS